MSLHCCRIYLVVTWYKFAKLKINYIVYTNKKRYYNLVLLFCTFLDPVLRSLTPTSTITMTAATITTRTNTPATTPPIMPPMFSGRGAVGRGAVGSVTVGGRGVDRTSMASGHSGLSKSAITTGHLLLIPRRKLCTTTLLAFWIHCLIYDTRSTVAAWLVSTSIARYAKCWGESSKHCKNGPEMNAVLKPHPHRLSTPCTSPFVISSVFRLGSSNVYWPQSGTPLKWSWILRATRNYLEGHTTIQYTQYRDHSVLLFPYSYTVLPLYLLGNLIS